MTKPKNTILEISRQDQMGALSPWFDKHLDICIDDGYFGSEKLLTDIGNHIIEDLIAYRIQTGISTVILGMSGGVDSALTAALFKRAGWKVIGVTMPIHQDPEETTRGVDACEALGIEHKHIDLTSLYNDATTSLGDLDGLLDDANETNKAVLIRRGNVKARLRMITLYNLAAMHGGLVASTDNYSELAAGFWTLHGDVGDLSPIQSLTKSWEVPMLAKLFGVPEETWRAKPTDGLGVDAGDEAQFGFTYLELDLMLLAIGDFSADGYKDDEMQELGGVNRENLFKVMDGDIDKDGRATTVFNKLLDRMGSSWFKRHGTVNIKHPYDSSRYNRLERVDYDQFVPQVIKRSN